MAVVEKRRERMGKGKKSKEQEEKDAEELEALAKVMVCLDAGKGAR